MYPERYEFPILYRNLGHNHFKDVTAEVGLKPVGLVRATPPSPISMAMAGRSFTSST